MKTVCHRYRCSVLSIGTYADHFIHVVFSCRPSSVSYSRFRCFGLLGHKTRHTSMITVCPRHNCSVYWYVYESFCSRSFSLFTFVHFYSRFDVCPAGPQHLSYLNECCLPSLSMLGAAYLYIYKIFYQLVFSLLTFVF